MPGLEGALYKWWPLLLFQAWEAAQTDLAPVSHVAPEHSLTLRTGPWQEASKE